MMIGKIYKKTFFVYFLLFISLTALVASGIFFWNQKVNKITIKPTRLNILDITSTNKMKVIQFGIDYFLNTGKYVAIIPFDVQAGFDLSKAKIEEVVKTEKIAKDKDINNIPKFVLRLPEPVILNVDKSDNGSLTIIEPKKPDQEFVKALRIFGENYAKNMALQRDILSKANARAKKVFRTFAKDAGISIDVITQETKEIKTQYIESKRSPLMIKQSDDFEYVNQENDLSTISLLLRNKKDQNESISIIPFSRPPSDQEDLPKQVKMYNPFNKDFQLHYNQKEGNCLKLDFLYKGVVYHSNIEAKDFQQLNNFLPKALMSLYSLRGNDNFIPPTNKDFYGATYERWENSDVNQLRNYINDYFNCKDFAQVFLIKSIGDVPVISNKEGKSEYEKDEKAITQNIKTALQEVSSLQEVPFSADQLILILYDYNKVHRDRFAFFMKDKVVFFTPSRKLILKTQPVIIIEIAYKDFNNKNKVNFKDNIFYFGEGDEVSFDEDISTMFNNSMKHGFISLFLH